MNKMIPSIYRQYFTPAECAMLDACPLDDLTSDIYLLRFLLARVLEAAQRARSLSLKQHAALLSAFSGSGVVIASLSRLHFKLHSTVGGLWKGIEAGLELARQQMGVYSYLPAPSDIHLGRKQRSNHGT